MRALKKLWLTIASIVFYGPLLFGWVGGVLESQFQMARGRGASVLGIIGSLFGAVLAHVARLTSSVATPSGTATNIKRATMTLAAPAFALLLLGGSTVLLFLGIPVAFTFIAINILGAILWLGGAVGIAGHLKVGDDAVVTAKSATSHDVEPGKVISGIPAFDNRDWLRSTAAYRKLGEMARKLREMENRIAKMETER